MPSFPPALPRHTPAASPPPPRYGYTDRRKRAEFSPFVPGRRRSAHVIPNHHTHNQPAPDKIRPLRCPLKPQAIPEQVPPPCTSGPLRGGINRSDRGRRLIVSTTCSEVPWPVTWPYPGNGHRAAADVPVCRYPTSPPHNTHPSPRPGPWRRAIRGRGEICPGHNP